MANSNHKSHKYDECRFIITANRIKKRNRTTRREQFSVRTIEVTCRTTEESCKPQQWQRDTHAAAHQRKWTTRQFAQVCSEDLQHGFGWRTFRYADIRPNGVPPSLHSWIKSLLVYSRAVVRFCCYPANTLPFIFGASLSHGLSAVVISVSLIYYSCKIWHAICRPNNKEWFYLCAQDNFQCESRPSSASCNERSDSRCDYSVSFLVFPCRASSPQGR